MPELRLTRRAREDLEAFPETVLEAVLETLALIGAEPERAGKRLVGRLEGLWSARVGHYRVLYRVEGGGVTVRGDSPSCGRVPPSARWGMVWARSVLTCSAPMGEMSDHERRARIAVRHHLGAGAGAQTPVQVADALVALHGTDPASVYLAAWSRMQAPHMDAVQRALYTERSLVRILGMRRTMFVLSRELAAIVQAACTRTIAARERRRTIGLIEQDGLARDGARWLRAAEEATLAALELRGEALAAELAVDVPALAEQIVLSPGKPYGRRQAMSGRVLAQLAADGHVVRAQPRGSWTSSQYRWAAVTRWLGAPLAEWTTEDAQAALAERWLAAFGPAPLSDLRWWTGWTAGELKRALGRIQHVEVELETGSGMALAGDLGDPPAPEPWAALLPALDPTIMGWSAREWYLGPHAPSLFDRTGNAGPSVWWCGRVVGGWAQRADGEIALRLLEDVGAEARATIDSEAQRLGEGIDEVRVTPRFRTPLERELVA